MKRVQDVHVTFLIRYDNSSLSNENELAMRHWEFAAI
jgi:hypothetical protein